MKIRAKRAPFSRGRLCRFSEKLEIGAETRGIFSLRRQIEEITPELTPGEQQAHQQAGAEGDGQGDDGRHTEESRLAR